MAEATVAAAAAAAVADPALLPCPYHHVVVLCLPCCYEQANYNMDSDAASEAASSAAKSLDEKSSVASETPLMPERKWIRTHAWIQGLTLILLVSHELYSQY
jgi:hypothetical protein